MYAKTRQLFIALLFVFCLLASSVPVMAQDANVPDGPVITPLGQEINLDLANAPAAEEVAEADLAADEEFQNNAAFAESLSEEQRAAFGEILAKYKLEMESITNDLQNGAGDNQLFLPGIVSDNEQASASTGPSSNVPSPLHGTEPQQQVIQAHARIGSVQDAINQELAALLTAEQLALFEKTRFAQSPQEASASAVQGADAPQDFSSCYYANLYGSNYYAGYYAYYAELWAYYDLVYNGNLYTPAAFYLSYPGKQAADLGALYAGTALASSYTFGSPGSYNDTAYYYFSWDNYGAAHDFYWAYIYSYYSYAYGGSSYYGYYAQYYAYYAYYYSYYAADYSYYC